MMALEEQFEITLDEAGARLGAQAAGAGDGCLQWGVCRCERNFCRGLTHSYLRR